MTELARRGLAIRIVAEVEKDFRGRRGLRQEWDQIDTATQDEIRARWVELVEQQLPEETETDDG